MNTENKTEGHFIFMRRIIEYYIRNKDAFLFSLIQVFGNREMDAILDQMAERGVDTRKMVQVEEEFAFYPSKLQLSVVTLTFWIAHCHRHNFKPRLSVEAGGARGMDGDDRASLCSFPSETADEIPSEEQVQSILDSVEKRIACGLGLVKDRLDLIDYDDLEKRSAETVYEDTQDNNLLRAVAGAVAEAGPWNASLEMVAHRSGLSKSGLYAHFKSKQDMMAQLFLTEFTRIINYAELSINASAVPEEQLYLAIISIADYLRSRPEILVALDWIRTRQLNLGHTFPPRLYRFITQINLDIFNQVRDVVPDSDGETPADWIAQWVLFLIINTLMRFPKPGERPFMCGSKAKTLESLHLHSFAEIPNDSFRILYRFIAAGLKGF
jgi:AcrR family transcriptional regulator